MLESWRSHGGTATGRVIVDEHYRSDREEGNQDHTHSPHLGCRNPSSGDGIDRFFFWFLGSTEFEAKDNLDL